MAAHLSHASLPASALPSVCCRFGTRARGIKNKVAVNTRLSPELLQQQLAKANARVSAQQHA
jgi:hypothetical protein